jgi:hypothetical protein
MRKINDCDKSIINIILGQDLRTISTLGELLKSYFNDRESALLILASIRKVYTFYNIEHKREDIYSLLVKIISLIETMEKEGLVYCLCKEQNLIIYAPSDNSVGIDSNETILRITGGEIKIEENTAILRNEQGDTILNGELVTGPISSKILYYFNCIIYPSDSLYILRKNNFDSLEILSYKNEVKAAKCSRNVAWLALLISLLLPFGMTFFNNVFSKTEIQQEQYKTIIMKMDNNSEKTDSLVKLFKYIIECTPKKHK